MFLVIEILLIMICLLTLIYIDKSMRIRLPKPIRMSMDSKFKAKQVDECRNRFFDVVYRVACEMCGCIHTSNSRSLLGSYPCCVSCSSSIVGRRVTKYARLNGKTLCIFKMEESEYDFHQKIDQQVVIDDSRNSDDV